MTRVLSPVVVLIMLSSASVASADTYLGLGIGSGAHLTGDFDAEFHTNGANSARVFLGEKFGALAIEVSLSKANFYIPANNRAEFSSLSLGADARYHVPLVGGLEAYGRLGLHLSRLDREDASFARMSGTGLAYGAGLQFSFSPGPLSSLSIFLDHTRQRMDVANTTTELDGEVAMTTLGLAVGL